MRSSHSQFFGVVAALLAATSLGNAQFNNVGSGANAGASRSSARAPESTRAAHLSKLVPGTELSFLIVAENESSKVVVTDSGEIEIPGGLGLVSVAGMTASQAAAEIKSYLEQRYYKAGKGTVRLGLNKLPVAPPRKFTVTVSGKVNRAGVFESLADSPKTLSEFVLEAGVSPYSNLKEVEVIKKNGERKSYDVKAILDGRAEDPKLEAGDKVVVPPVKFAL